MKRVIHGIFFLSFGLHTLLAQNSIISSIHQIEPTVNHYAELRTLSSNQQPSFAWMDTIAYPPELYRNNTILFALTKPIYLTDQQVGFLIKSAEHPANSSKQTRAELDFLLELQKNRTDEQVKRVLELAAIGRILKTSFLRVMRCWEIPIHTRVILKRSSFCKVS